MATREAIAPHHEEAESQRRVSRPSCGLPLAHGRIVRSSFGLDHPEEGAHRIEPATVSPYIWVVGEPRARCSHLPLAGLAAETDPDLFEILVQL